MGLVSYKNRKLTSVDWLPKLPVHWKVIRFRHMFDFGRGLGITKSNLKDQGIPCVNYGEIHSKFGFEVSPEKNALKCVDESYLDDGEASLLKYGDFVFADTSEDLDGAGNFTYLNSDTPTFAGYHTVIARLQTDDLPRYLAYLFDSEMYRFQIRKSVTGVKVFSVTQAILKSSYLWLPPKDEQEAIIQFLDHRLQRIDALVKKKIGIIQALKEQRISIINMATTQSLEANKRIKQSGVDWLPKLPEHWKVIRFRHMFDFGRGLGITKSNLKDQGIPCVNYGEIHSKFGFEVSPEKNALKCVDESYLDDGEASLLKYGDFVFADTSEDLDGAGNFTYLNSDTPTFAGYHTIIARLQTDDLPRYLAYLFDSEMYRFQIRKSVTGVKVFSVTQAILKSSYLWLPPKDEQKAIVQFLDSKTIRIDKTIKVNEQAISKLLEYRTSLITAAVTGQIDVRNVDLP
ncbi:restriction endonuclease subunit S [Vibrio parahaemolyticus]|uniref:restriction endonuclease subunit S n=1 Tax=Vibrio parahaemolyticus TaxID=670 RepID=UPI001A1FCD44|nr:restriction endonuclease subunit S [Vibrio parahaemolyticus]MCX8764081.1 restriction endonuclease subunit S [Vibrio parahaemolyticus]HAT7739449.1 restriction endonuclease subunit S [Vibrio vulnificus]